VHTRMLAPCSSIVVTQTPSACSKN
jgi:hypothetical protein